MLRPTKVFCNSLLTAALASLIASATPAMASDAARVAAAKVSETSYRHFLDDMLFTHNGDDRGFGPEHDLARDNIATLMESFGLTVSYEAFNYGGGTYFNVVGTKTGTTTPDRVYILGAHYDSVDNPGADDDASGVALVLETARVLSAYDSASTIRFIAFDREEQGLVGSQAYVAAHQNDNILGMIQADMVAYNLGNDVVDIYGYAPSNPIKLALSQAVETYGRGLSAVVYGPMDASDHAPFEWAGFEACLIIEEWGNPNYHTALDSVDTPGYIDYGFATSITRAVTALLTGHAQVNVTMPDGDFDADGDVDSMDIASFDGCYSGEGVRFSPPACGFFDYDADGDVDCLDREFLVAVWTEPGQPATLWLCNLVPPEVEGFGARCIHVTPPTLNLPMAMLVTDSLGDGTTGCLSLYVRADGRLGGTPVFQLPDAWGTVYICDAVIVPEQSYSVACDYGVSGSAVLSPAAAGSTGVWGDTVGPVAGGAWQPPDGSIDIIDVVAILDRLRSDPTAPDLHYVDLIGADANGMTCGPDGVVSILDVVVALTAFRGLNFFDSTQCLGPCAP